MQQKPIQNYVPTGGLSVTSFCVCLYTTGTKPRSRTVGPWYLTGLANDCIEVGRRKRSLASYTPHRCNLDMRGGTLQTCWILFYRKNSCPRARARIRVCVCMALFSLQTCHLECGNANRPTPSSLVHTVSLRVLLSLAAWSFFFFIAEYKIYLFLQVVVAKVSDLKPFFIRTVLCINKQPVPGKGSTTVAVFVFVR